MAPFGRRVCHHARLLERQQPPEHLRAQQAQPLCLALAVAGPRSIEAVQEWRRRQLREFVTGQEARQDQHGMAVSTARYSSQPLPADKTGEGFGCRSSRRL